MAYRNTREHSVPGTPQGWRQKVQSWSLEAARYKWCTHSQAHMDLEKLSWKLTKAHPFTECSLCNRCTDPRPLSSLSPFYHPSGYTLSFPSYGVDKTQTDNGTDPGTWSLRGNKIQTLSKDTSPPFPSSPALLGSALTSSEVFLMAPSHLPPQATCSSNCHVVQRPRACAPHSSLLRSCWCPLCAGH